MVSSVTGPLVLTCIHFHWPFLVQIGFPPSAVDLLVNFNELDAVNPGHVVCLLSLVINADCWKIAYLLTVEFFVDKFVSQVGAVLERKIIEVPAVFFFFVSCGEEPLSLRVQLWIKVRMHLISLDK